jgi:hypothetical protein
MMMNEASARIADVTLARPTLDDVFLQKTGHHLEVGAQPSEQQEVRG